MTCEDEDIDFAFRLKQYGKKVESKFKTIVRVHIVSSCSKFDKFGDWYFLQTKLTREFYLDTGGSVADKH